jgi:AcrR family transcriptional regulator
MSTTGQQSDRVTPVSEPGYTRLQVDERRRRLLESGTDLFTRYSFDELSMAKIAREAGVSKALLYHYFPSKADFFEATMRQAAEEIAARTEPDPDLPPAEALAASLGAFLEWIEENELAYRKLMQSANSVGDAVTLIEEVRAHTAGRMLAGLDHDPTPKVRAAVRAWLWFMDGACLDWLEHRDMERDELRDLLMGALVGALAAAGFDLSKLAAGRS